MKVHYVINSYIPSDENIVATTTYKFQKIGDKTKKYGWISIDNYHGIGTGTDNFGEDSEGEGLMQILSFLDNSKNSVVKHIYTNNFEEVLEKRQEIISKLEKYLK